MPRKPRNLYKVGRIWYARIEKNGKQIRPSLDTDELAVAQERLAVLKREITGAKWGEQPTRTYDDAARRFKAEHCKRLRPRGAERYIVSMVVLADHFHRVPLTQIGSAKLGDFETARLSQGVTTATVRRDLACLSSIFTRAEEWEWIETNPVKAYMRRRKKYLPDSAPRKRWLPHTEEEEVLLFAPPKAAIAIRFAIDTGLRKEEQFSIEMRDIDMVKKQITVRPENGKGGKGRTIPLLPRTLAWLKSLPAARLPHLPLFMTHEGKRYTQSPTMWEALQKAVKRANKSRAAAGRPLMEHVAWHDLRRTCGCRLLQDHGFSFEEVRDWLGHADIRITQQRYAFLGVNKLHEAIERRGKIVPYKSADPS